MSAVPFDSVVQLALQLSPAEQARLIERVAAAMQDSFTDDHETSGENQLLWTDEEIAEMTKIEPLTGAEIVARGLTGGWEDLGITDGAEWVNEQKRKRRGKYHW